MPSTRDVEVPAEAATVARRYRRVERPTSGAVAVLTGVVAAVALLAFPLVPGLVAAAGAFALVRVPTFRSRGTATLVTGASPETVRTDFESATPPPLALQWGVADRVRLTPDGATYEVSYLFGLRSARLTVESRSLPAASEADEAEHERGGADDDRGRSGHERDGENDERDGNDHGQERNDGRDGSGHERGEDDGRREDDIELVVRADGRPWATYTVSVRGRDGGTTVEYEWDSDRRFGLRRLPQWLVAERYREAALAAQGYTVVEREASVGI